MQASPIDFDKYITSYTDFPRPGILFRDISPLLASARGMTCAIDQLASQAAGLAPDLVAGIESRGFLFSTLLAARLGIGSMMIRKPGKLPGDLVDETYDLEYGSAVLTMQVDAPVAGRSVLLIDDLLIDDPLEMTPLHRSLLQTQTQSQRPPRRPKGRIHGFILVPFE